jgi:branched-chain amino acid transport system ATP-binding protein
MTTTPTPLLTAQNIHVSYGPVQVLFGVDLEVPRGGRVALLGTNGAGKSTLLKALSGLLPIHAVDGAFIAFDGEDVGRLSVEERVERGLVQMGGGRSTFPSLTVEENLRMGAYPFLGDAPKVRAALDDVYGLFPVLAERRKQRAGTLSGGEQQMMALGRTLIAGPKLLMIDELSLGLAPVVIQEILRVIDELVRRGVSLVVVEQSLNVAMSITERAVFMEKGEVRFSGRTADLLDRGDLVRSVFFGAEATA